MDTVGWLARDTNMLDRIKLRHPLNVAQEKLALAAKLTAGHYGASLAWRDALGATTRSRYKIFHGTYALGETNDPA